MHSPIPMSHATSLHSIGINSGRLRIVVLATLDLLFAVIVDILDVESVDVAGKVSQERQSDVDEEIGAAACNAIHADRWDYTTLANCIV